LRFATRVQSLGGARAGAWDIHRLASDRQAAGEDIIVLSIGEADFETPPPIVEAAVQGLRSGRTRYTGAAGVAAFRDVVARHHTALTGQIVTVDNVVIEPGAQCGLFAACLVCCDPGSEVIVAEPAYVTYEAVIGASGAIPVYVPMRLDDGFRLDPTDVAAAVTPRSRAILLNTPHNPTGAVISQADMAAIGEIARSHDLWIIADEVYAQLIYEGKHISPWALPELKARTLSISSLSKSHAMTGWRLGWVVAPRQVATHLAELSIAMLYGLPAFLQDAGGFALMNDLAEVAEMKGAYRARRDCLYAALKAASGLVCHRPPSGMFVMADIRATGLTGDAFAQRLLDDYGVSVLSGDAFGSSTQGFVRISLAEPDARLAEAARRIAAFTKSLL
jgi:arginine:pyruvate transaminase